MPDCQPSFAVLGQATAKNTQSEAIVTGAKLIGGQATDQTKYRKTQTVQLSDPVTVAGPIAAETGHLNQPVEMVVYVAYTPLSAPDGPPLYFMLDNNLGIQQWDENVNTLVAFQTMAAWKTWPR